MGRWQPTCARRLDRGDRGATVGYATHAAAAAARLPDRGQDATLTGTGNPPQSVWEMMAWMIPAPDWVGVAVIAVAIVHLVRSRPDLLPLLGLFAVAGAGLFVARPYWGFVFIPFGLLLCGEWLADTSAAIHASGEGPGRPRSRSPHVPRPERLRQRRGSWFDRRYGRVGAHPLPR